ncbi:hypothetical protein [Wolbachia endosymbiont of Mansonella perstans]|uniref:hypothetical protein n=1 Tax=Wolbachia endosymbiont of Mansonella perstans TaxID=229526 RepID=UPI001CE0B5CE|nr:hypothetical protein [Wolbachia endosymbiont of Mansonella perstans]
MKEAAESFLKNANITDVDLADSEKVIELLNCDKGRDFLDAISKKLSEEETLKELVEQIGKDRVMMEKFKALDNQLST